MSRECADARFAEKSLAAIDGRVANTAAGSVICRPWHRRGRIGSAAGAERDSARLSSQSRNTAAGNARHNPGHKRGMRRIRYTNAEDWKEQLHEASKKSPPPRRGKRVWLVCGETSMYTGLDGLHGIIRYQLNHSPYDGNLYVFRDLSGTMIKYLEWDGAGFCLSKRRAQSGSYPWPPAEAGKVLEITEKEFEYLKSRSIVPCKEKKPR